VRVTTLIGAAILLSGCGFRGQNHEAEARVAHFHQLFNDENVEGLLGLIAPEFRGTADPETFAALMRGLQEQLGDTQQSQLKDWRVEYLPQRRLTLIYQTRFERGEATEMFTFDYKEPPRLVRYNATVSSAVSNRLILLGGGLGNLQHPLGSRQHPPLTRTHAGHLMLPANGWGNSTWRGNSVRF
jgi:hypothetical protein